MLSPDEHPGIFTFLVGVGVIVLVAVGLSMVMEKRFAFSSGGLRLAREVAVLDDEVDGVRERLDSATVRLAEMEGPRARALETLRKTDLEAAAAVKRKEDLAATRDGFVEKIAKTEQAFLDFRMACRSASRAGAVGEEIAMLTLQDGRNYQEVVITKVTEVGLEIRHQHGIARIDRSDLGPDWQDRFHWDREEHWTRLHKETLVPEGMSVSEAATKSPQPKRVVASKIKPGGRPIAAVPDEPQKLSALRMRFNGWISKVALLQSEYDEAITNSARQTSVPGRLETWNARAARLRGELSKARVELAAARARLVAISPNDTLLTPGLGGSRNVVR